MIYSRQTDIHHIILQLPVLRIIVLFLIAFAYINVCFCFVLFLLFLLVFLFVCLYKLNHHDCVEFYYFVVCSISSLPSGTEGLWILSASSTVKLHCLLICSFSVPIIVGNNMHLNQSQLHVNPFPLQDYTTLIIQHTHCLMHIDIMH